MVKFNDKWLDKEDSTGRVVRTYGKKIHADNDFSFYCLACSRTVQTTKGFEKINQHVKTKTHADSITKYKPQSQATLKTVDLPRDLPQQPLSSFLEPDSSLLKGVEGCRNNENPFENSLTSQNSSNNAQQKVNQITLYIPKQDVLKAELLWCIDLVCKKNSARSCYGIKELFQRMFSCKISDDFTISSTKASYLINEALGPFFHNELLEDFKHDDFACCVQYDETKNCENKKELQIRIIYFSTKESLVKNCHLETKFIAKGDGDKLFTHLLDTLRSNDINLKSILTLGRDGPNVNKKVERLFDNKLRELNLKGIVKIGSCYLHIVNNALQTALDHFPIDVSDFIIKTKIYFDRSDLRWTTFKTIQDDLKLPKHKFIEHSSTRWSTIGIAAQRMDEQLPALKYYFLEYIPKKEPKTQVKTNYLEIVKYLKEPFLKCTLQFTAYIAALFCKHFLVFMQKQEPLIHILFTQLQKLVMLMMTSILKQNLQTKKETFVLKNKLFESSGDVKEVLSFREFFAIARHRLWGRNQKEFRKFF